MRKTEIFHAAVKEKKGRRKGMISTFFADLLVSLHAISIQLKKEGPIQKLAYSRVPNNTAAVLFFFWKKFLPTFNFHLNKKKILPTFLFSYVINQVENFPPTLLFGPAVLLGTLE